MSKTKEALKRVAAGEKVSTVARALGITTQVIYAAKKRERETTRCPCCQQVVRPTTK